MLCDDRQHDMQRAAAFIKRLASFSLCFGAAESMTALVTLKHLLQKNVKCRDLLENDAGGGSLSGSISKYQPYATDPSLSGAFATILWELTLLSKHYHPTVSTMASNEVAVDEKVVRDKLTEHFLLVNDMEKNERLRRELEQTKIGLQLYKQYRKQKKQRTR
nr:hypothetical protein [Tanacetum cinerariifolium]